MIEKYINRGDQSSIEMYLSKSSVTYLKNTPAAAGRTNSYFYLSKSKK